ncbi:MAG: C1 family peptidase, partial [Candidatus Paralactobacillus gallistercoris]|nr:C1 family peptidase [Candidatus Paralactobacillus gallistercoris]
MSRAISEKDLHKYEADYQTFANHDVLMRAVANNGINAASETSQAKAAMHPVYSLELDTGQVTDQKKSGRCWMFAALNTMRHYMQQKYCLKDDFELSQNYTFFWDKFEKANYFYQNILRTGSRPIDDRKVQFLLTTPQQDGGQWDMLCAIVEKYGIVPKYAMPETYNSSNSNELNTLFNNKLRKDALILRQLVADKATMAVIDDARNKMLNEDYRILVYSLGEPPVKFDFEYYDQDNHYHIDRNLTPKSFFDNYLDWNLADYVSVINAPTKDKPYNHVYTVDMLGNVIGGRQVRHLNLRLHEFKKLAVKQLQGGEPVWFGCDVVKDSDRKIGIMDPHIYDRESLFDINLSMAKAERLEYGESMMTHAMVLTGVDLDDNDEPIKWKVENSWGDKVGKKGYFVMSDQWFDEYVYQLVINKQYLSIEARQIHDQEYNDPIILKPWDPMGALA